MEKYFVKRKDNTFQVVERKTKTVISTHFFKSFAKDMANDLNFKDPKHPKHWVHLVTI